MGIHSFVAGCIVVSIASIASRPLIVVVVVGGSRQVGCWSSCLAIVSNKSIVLPRISSIPSSFYLFYTFWKYNPCHDVCDVCDGGGDGDCDDCHDCGDCQRIYYVNGCDWNVH